MIPANTEEAVEVVTITMIRAESSMTMSKAVATADRVGVVVGTSMEAMQKKAVMVAKMNMAVAKMIENSMVGAKVGDMTMSHLVAMNEGMMISMEVREEAMIMSHLVAMNEEKMISMGAHLGVMAKNVDMKVAKIKAMKRVATAVEVAVVIREATEDHLPTSTRKKSCAKANMGAQEMQTSFPLLSAFWETTSRVLRLKTSMKDACIRATSSCINKVEVISSMTHPV